MIFPNDRQRVRRKTARSSKRTHLPAHILVRVDEFLALHTSEDVNETDFFDLSQLDEGKKKVCEVFVDAAHNGRSDANKDVSPPEQSIYAPREESWHAQLRAIEDEYSVFAPTFEKLKRLRRSSKKATGKGRQKVEKRIRAELQAYLTEHFTAWENELDELEDQKKAFGNDLQSLREGKYKDRRLTEPSFLNKPGYYPAISLAFAIGESILNYGAAVVVGGTNNLGSMLISSLIGGILAYSAHGVGESYAFGQKFKPTFIGWIGGGTFVASACLRSAAVIGDGNRVPTTSPAVHLMAMVFSVIVYAFAAYLSYRRQQDAQYWDLTRKLAKINARITELECLTRTLEQTVELTVEEILDGHRARHKALKSRYEDIFHKGYVAVHRFHIYIRDQWKAGTGVYRQAYRDQCDYGVPEFWARPTPPYSIEDDPQSSKDAAFFRSDKEPRPSASDSTRARAGYKHYD